MPNSPWNSREPPSRARLFIWIGLMLAIALGGWLMARAVPEQTLSGYDEGRLAYTVALLALISSGVVFSRQFRLREALRNIAIWAAIAAVLGLGFLYQDVFADIGARLGAEFLPAEPRMVGDHTVVLTMGEDGSYVAVGEVNGVRVRFLVDTGASDIVLSPQDARRIGVDADALTFTGETATANGVGRSAPYAVDSLAVGPLRFSHVAVAINQAPMDSSLLGMTFLRRLTSFEFRDRKLYLRW